MQPITCIMSILYLILYYSYIKYHHWGKLGKGTWDSAYHFFCNFLSLQFHQHKKNLKILLDKQKSSRGLTPFSIFTNTFFCFTFPTVFDRELIFSRIFPVVYPKCLLNIWHIFK